MWTSDIHWEEFEFAADAWQWLDDNGFRQSMKDHLSFVHADGRTAMLCLPEGETADESTEIKIFL
ncbi:hypothetical protein [Polaromonas aquatica]|uniref:Uncharacterized protein n=1 Tax=Polaromonas aquatica TaxID=332657 RepID=A0ABW1TU62_9BURK